MFLIFIKSILSPSGGMEIKPSTIFWFDQSRKSLNLLASKISIKLNYGCNTKKLSKIIFRPGFLYVPASKPTSPAVKSASWRVSN